MKAKNGCEIADLDQLYEFIAKECPNLRFKGLMTIGKEGDMSAFGQMDDLKRKMCEKYKLKEDEFELSMGMSSDFEVAVINGLNADKKPFDECEGGKFDIWSEELPK